MSEEIGHRDDVNPKLSYLNGVYQDKFNKQAAGITVQNIPFTYRRSTDRPDNAQAKNGDCSTNCCMSYYGFDVGIQKTSPKGNPQTAIRMARAQTAAQSWLLRGAGNGGLARYKGGAWRVGEGRPGDPFGGVWLTWS